MDLGLEVKAFREARYRCSSLGCKVRVDLIGRDYELEISEILFMVDPRDCATYNMYSCDTCCMSREMMDTDGRDSAKCRKSKLRDMIDIIKIV